MTTLHAVVRIDHQSAEILQFDADHVHSQKIKTHAQYTRQHHSGVRTEHEFYGHVADALVGVTEVLVAGAGTAHAAFISYCEKHRPDMARHIVGSETVDHPTDPQLIAMARKYFLRYDAMAGKPLST